VKFGYTILYVDDVDLTLAFYEKAFGLARRFLHESGTYGELETGATTLAFASRAMLREIGKNPMAPQAGAPTSEIAFIANDVGVALERALTAGATLVQTAKQMPWGQTIAYVNDLNGFLVEICTAMG
jgi:lactoylglutathione lyase